MRGVTVRKSRTSKHYLDVLRAVQESDIPVDPSWVGRKVGLSRVGARNILLRLLEEGKILGTQTTKGWIFWAE